MKNEVSLIGYEQLSHILGVKKTTLYAWVHWRRIPFYRLGGMVRFDPDEIQRWLKQNHNVQREVN